MSDGDTFGKRLRAARAGAGLSQSALAEICGIPKPRLSRYENDHILPSLGSLRRLAEAIGVTQEALLTGGTSPVDVFLDEIRSSGIRFASVRQARKAAADVIARYDSVHRAAGPRTS